MSENNVFRWWTKCFQVLLRSGNFLSLCLSLVPFVILLYYVNRYKANFPRGDHALDSLDIGIRAATGQLTWHDIFTGTGTGHVMVFTRLQSAFMARFFSWNIVGELSFNFVLGIAIFAVYLFLTYRLMPSLVRWAAPSVALLVFSTYQDPLWVSPHFTQWLYPLFFTLLSLVVLVSFPGNFYTLIGAMLLCFCATLSNGNGIVSWAALFIAVIWRYPRRWLVYVVWIAAAFAALWLFTTLGSIALSSENTSLPAPIPAPLAQIPTYILGFMGSPMMTHPRNLHTSAWLGLLAVVLFGVNALFLHSRRMTLIPWLTVAFYSLITASLLAISRGNTYRNGIEAAMMSYYRAASLPFWVALIVLMVFSVLIITKEHGFRWYTPLMHLNVIAGSGMLVLYIVAQLMTLNTYQIFYTKDFTEYCYVRFMFYQDHERLNFEDDCLVVGGNIMNDLSMTHLSLFADWDPVNILPENYRAGELVLVETDSAWINMHLREWYLDGVADEDVVNVAPNLPTTQYSTPFDVPDNFVSPGSGNLQDVLNAFMGNLPNTIWHVYREDQASYLDTFWVQLAEERFVSTRYRFTNEVDVTFIIERYDRLSSDEVQLSYGDNIRLDFVRVEGVLAPCETISMVSFWSTDGAIDMPHGYSASLSVLDSQSTTLARQDAQLGVEPTQTWEPGRLYTDVRELQIPCGLASGEYMLGFGVYDWMDQRRLPVFGGALPATDDFGIIATFTVSSESLVE